MVVSMTGFGSSKRESDQFTVTVEMKTVNHRFSEFNIRMPRELLGIEDKLKKKLSEYLFRGRAEVFVTIEGEGTFKRKVQVDWDLLDDYYQQLIKIQSKYELHNDLTLKDLVNQDEIISIVEEQADNKQVEQLVLEAATEAVIQLKRMRVTEGQALEQDVKGYLKEMYTSVQHLKEYAPTVVSQYSERLTKRMKDFIDGQIDEYRMITEVAIFADKADISEELTRLYSHIEQFSKTLQLNEPIGRKLDFILQEMNREINTIGSKANDSAITQEVVNMKSLLEKTKEQVQNIE